MSGDGVREWAYARGVRTDAQIDEFLRRIGEISRAEGPVYGTMIFPTPEQGERVVAEMRRDGLIVD